MKTNIYCIFWTIRCTPPIWEENGGASYSPNVDYLGRWGAERGGSRGVGFFFFPYFPPLKPRYVLWSGVSYNPKNMINKYIIMSLDEGRGKANLGWSEKFSTGY